MNLRQKANGVWFVDFDWTDPDTKSTSRRRVSCGTRDKAAAREKARGIVLGLTPPSSPTPASEHAKPVGMTMCKLFSRCESTVWHPREAKSQATIASNLRILRAVVMADGRPFGDYALSEVTFTVLEALKDILFAREYAAGTVKRKLDMVGKALTMATKWTDEGGKSLLPGKPAMPTITTRNARDRELTTVEEAAVFDAVRARAVKEQTRNWRRFGVLLRFLLDTGCRLGEALGSHVDHLEAPGEFPSALVRQELSAVAVGQRLEPSVRAGIHYVTFPRYTTKNDKPRRLPLTPAITAELDYLKTVSIDGRLFPLKAATAWYMWDGIRDDLAAKGFDLSDVVLHSFRHTCLSRLARRMDIAKVSRWAGHSSVQVTVDHYAHLRGEDFHDALAVLSQ